VRIRKRGTTLILLLTSPGQFYKRESVRSTGAYDGTRVSDSQRMALESFFLRCPVVGGEVKIMK
jgi:hypothetical protein